MRNLLLPIVLAGGCKPGPCDDVSADACMTLAGELGETGAARGPLMLLACQKASQMACITAAHDLVSGSGGDSLRMELATQVDWFASDLGNDYVLSHVGTRYAALGDWERAANWYHLSCARLPSESCLYALDARVEAGHAPDDGARERLFEERRYEWGLTATWLERRPHVASEREHLENGQNQFPGIPLSL